MATQEQEEDSKEEATDERLGRHGVTERTMIGMAGGTDLGKEEGGREYKTDNLKKQNKMTQKIGLPNKGGWRA